MTDIENINSSLLSTSAIRCLLDNNGILAEPAIVQMTKFKMFPKPNGSGNCAWIYLYDGSHFHYFFLSSTLLDQLARDGFNERYQADERQRDILLIKQTRSASNSNSTSPVVIEDYELLATAVPFLFSHRVESPGLFQADTTEHGVQSESTFADENVDPMDTSPPYSTAYEATDNVLPSTSAIDQMHMVVGMTDSWGDSFPPTPPPRSDFPISPVRSITPLERADSPSADNENMDTSPSPAPQPDSTASNSTSGPFPAPTPLVDDSDVPLPPSPVPTASVVPTGFPTTPVAFTTPVKRATSPDEATVPSVTKIPAASPSTSPQKPSSKNPTINRITDRLNGKVWNLRGKCIDRENIRVVCNGAKRVLNFILEDETGTIRIAGWDKCAEKVDALIQKNRSYSITGMKIKKNDSPFNQTGHLFEITLNDASEITPCDEVKTTLNIQPSSLDTIHLYREGLIDVLAIVHEIKPVDNGISMKTGKPYTKRKVSLIDRSKATVVFTLWREEAVQFDEQASGKIIAIRSAHINEFNGAFELDAGHGTKWELSPDLPQATDLLGWYHNEYRTDNASDDDEMQMQENQEPPLNVVPCPLDEIRDKSESFFDVLAVVHEIKPLDNGFSMKTNKPYTNRKISLIDKSESIVTLTLWSDEARKFEENAWGQVIAMKSVRLDEFNGNFGLKIVQGTTKWELSPDLEEAGGLCEWYHNVYLNEDSSEDDQDVMTIGTILEEGDELRGDEIKVKAKITDITIKKMHMACIKCHHKIPKSDVDHIRTQNMHGYKFFDCSNCDAYNTVFKWGYIAEVELVDDTDSFTVTALDKVMEKVLGKTGDEIGDFLEKDDVAYRRVVDEAKTKEFIWNIKAKAGYHCRIRETTYEVKNVNQIGGSERSEAQVYEGVNLAEALATMDQD